MAVHKASTQGRSFKYDTETALGTAAGGEVFFRPDTFEFPTKISQDYIPASGGHINPASVNKAIPFKDGSDTGTITITARRATTTLEPTVGIFLKAAGWTMAKLTGATTVKTGTTTADLIMTADVGAENGSFALVETTDDRFELVHCAAWSVGTTSAVPLFLMSADPTDLDAIEQAFTYYPSSDPFAATDTLTFIHQSRVEDGAGNPQEWTYSGCALILKTITIEPNASWVFEFEVLIANVSVADGTWAAEVDHELPHDAKFNNDFEFLIEDAVAAGAGGAARTAQGIQRIVIDTGMAAQKITSVGGDADVNSVGGYIAKMTQPTWTISTLFDITRSDDFKTEFIGGTGTNPDVALMASCATQDQALYPAMAISSPKCNLISSPDTRLDGTDTGLVEMDYVFGANMAKLNEGDARADLGKASDAGSQSVYIGMGGTG